MPYKLNKQQYQAIILLDPKRRAEHFIKKVADWEQLWVIKNGADFFFYNENTGCPKAVPLWPHPDYAQAFCDTLASGFEVYEIPLQDFLDFWLIRFSSENIQLAIFPDHQGNFQALDAEQLLQALKLEISNYE